MSSRFEWVDVSMWLGCVNIIGLTSILETCQTRRSVVIMETSGILSYDESPAIGKSANKGQYTVRC